MKKKYFFLWTLLISSIGSAQINPMMRSNVSGKETNGAMSLGIKKEETYSISILITHIRNHNGVMRIKFFDDSTPFPHDTGIRKAVVPKTMVTGDSLRVTYDGFTSKNMGIALLDDENNNWKLDFGWFFPKEGHAFSDYYHAALRKPVYKDFRFFLAGDKKVIMRMKYY